MKILIVGAGVAGCGLAGFVNKYELGKVTLVERTEQPGNIGYMVGIWGNGRKMLRELGIEERVLGTEGVNIELARFENRRGKLMKAISFKNFSGLGVNIAARRADLQQGLSSALGKNVDIKLHTTVTNIQQKASGVIVEFSDSTQEIFDIVVGADGVNSSVREMVFGKQFKKYYGSGIWAYWLPGNFAYGRQFTQVRGNGKHYTLSYVHSQPMVWFQAPIVPGTIKSETEGKTKLRELFYDFNSHSKDILEVMPDPKNIFYSDSAYIDMNIWHTGRVVLIGDAQHAMSPILGMGVSLALEDGYVLADELRKNPLDIESALQKYSSRRQKRLNKMQRIQKRIEGGPTGELQSRLYDILISVMPTSFFLSPLRKFVEGKI